MSVYLALTLQYRVQGLLLLVISASDLPLPTIKFCSVVFGVTLSLLVINTSSTVSREQQRTPLTSDECHQLANIFALFFPTEPDPWPTR